jgi:hypothetical protein
MGDPDGGAWPARRGDSIDDVEVLRAGATARVLGHRVMAP